jgi:hypothetical protein
MLYFINANSFFYGFVMISRLLKINNTRQLRQKKTLVAMQTSYNFSISCYINILSNKKYETYTNLKERLIHILQ